MDGAQWVSTTWPEPAPFKKVKIDELPLIVFLLFHEVGVDMVNLEIRGVLQQISNGGGGEGKKSLYR